MKHLIISFKSRTNLYSFAKILNLNNISYSIINTPRSIAVNCGLSLQVNFMYLNKVVFLLKQNNFLGVIGIFIQTSVGSQYKFEKYL